MVHTVIAFLVFPLDSQRLELLIEKAKNRASFGLMFMYAQIGTLSTFYQLAIVIEYIIHYEHFLGKLMAYSVFGLGFLLAMLQTGYVYAALQTKIEEFIPEDASHEASASKKLYRLCIFLTIYCVGLLLYPLILAFFHK